MGNVLIIMRCMWYGKTLGWFVMKWKHEKFNYKYISIADNSSEIKSESKYVNIRYLIWCDLILILKFSIFYHNILCWKMAGLFVA